MALTRKQVPKLALIALLCACAGCGSRGVRVEGTVTLDGEPVDGGSISFFQGDGPGSDKGNAPIKQGKYVLEGEGARNLAPSTYTVKIFWIQLIGKQNPGNVDASAPAKEAIPPQYNTKSSLTRELVRGANVLDFDLKSK